MMLRFFFGRLLVGPALLEQSPDHEIFENSIDCFLSVCGPKVRTNGAYKLRN